MRLLHSGLLHFRPGILQGRPAQHPVQRHLSSRKCAQTIVEGIYPPEDENAAESREYTLSLDHMDANARVSETWNDGLVHIEVTIYSGDGTEKELYRLSADRDFS